MDSNVSDGSNHRVIDPSQISIKLAENPSFSALLNRSVLKSMEREESRDSQNGEDLDVSELYHGIATDKSIMDTPNKQRHDAYKSRSHRYRSNGDGASKLLQPVMDNDEQPNRSILKKQNIPSQRQNDQTFSVSFNRPREDPKDEAEQ